MYTATLDAASKTKEEFYASPNQVLSDVLEGIRLALLGNFNARVGRDLNFWNRTIGKETMVKVNSSSIFLMKMLHLAKVSAPLELW